ncbi:FG-GAP repeat domain-containing protein, partial [Streptomyces sp. NPDC021224]|uniref:FG-GAP repeat domain-containing protein n=1 Tax=Streptomyces sp. NPDC021224 TaxID=3365120 RepID=UPI0037BB6023
MKRHQLVRAAVAVTAVFSLGAGSALAVCGHAYAAGAADVRIPAVDATGDPAVSLVATGFDGELFQVEGTAGYQWTGNANGATKAVPALDGVPVSAITAGYESNNRIGYSSADADGSTRFTLLTVTTGTLTSFTVPAEDAHPVLGGGAALATRTAEDGSREYRIVRPVEGTLSDIPVQLPAGAVADEAPAVLAALDISAVVRWQQDGAAAYGIVNEITGKVQVLPVTGEASSFALSGDTVSWYTAQGTPAVHMMALGSTTAPRVVAVAPRPGAEVRAFTVGTHVVWNDTPGGPLHVEPAVPGESAQDVLPVAEQVLPGRDGLIVVGRDASGVRGIYQVFTDGTGTVVTYVRHTVPQLYYRGEVTGLTLDRGTVRVQNTVHGATTLRGESVGLGPEPRAGAELPVQDVPVSDLPGTPGRFADGGDEGVARLVVDPATSADALVTADDPAPVALPARGGRILGTSPRYVLYRTPGDTPHEIVVDIARNTIVRDDTAASEVLDYSTLWTASSGTLTATDLRTGAPAGSLPTGADCAPDDLRTNGPLLYWSCSAAGLAGVIETATGRTYPAPSGDVLLGDGFLAAYDPASGAIHVTALSGGTSTALDDVTGMKRPAADTDTRGLTWTVDPTSNKLAYVDSADTVHVVQAYPTAGPASQLTFPDRSVPAAFSALGADGGWHPRWWVSKPVATWQLTVTNVMTGAEARFYSGSAVTPAVRSISVSWDGRTGGGLILPSGTYRYELLAQAADGTGQSASDRGTVTMTANDAAPGALLGRDTSGTLWQYRTTGKAAAPYLARTEIAGAWDRYTALTSLSGQRSDASGDLVARDANGVLWYYPATGDSTAPLGTRQEVGGGWNTYQELEGAGDVTGDGLADLVARDASGTLWLYAGTGSAAAPFAARTKVGSGWGAYTALVGTNDVTGDGRSDLVARDASGTLWLYAGTGSAAAPFAARTKVGSGWGAYTALVGTN